MAQRAKRATAVVQPPMPAYGQPMLRLQRDAPGARWARLGLRVLVAAWLLAAAIWLASAVIHAI